MAKQTSMVKLKGTIDDLTFYETKDGHLVRKKGSLTKARLMNDPAFARTRENMSEFANAGKAGKLLRTAHRGLIKGLKQDRVLVRRMHKLMTEVLRTDTVSPRGERAVHNGDVSLMEGFDFNSDAQLGNSLFLGYSVVIDRATGEVKLEIPEFVPTEDIAYPSGATHVRFRAGASEVNFESNLYTSGKEETAWMPIDGASVPALDLVVNLTQNSTEQIFTLLSVEFGQEVNGEMYLQSNGSYNALAIVDVDTA